MNDDRIVIGDGEDRGVAVVVDADLIMRRDKAEIDVQIATAKAYPRAISSFQRDVERLATLTDEIAEECLYSLKRREQDGKEKIIIGPSARFAEVILSSWGNARAAARVIDVGREFVTAQGAFHDLERNVTVTREVMRRITTKRGTRYNDDMIGQTANAACSIAVRNAILNGIPKAFWAQGFVKVQAVVKGDAKTLVERRTAALAYFEKEGVPPEMVFAYLDVKGADDIGLDEMVVLSAIKASVRSGETTIAEAFAPAPAPAGTSAIAGEGKSGVEALKSRLTGAAPAPEEAATAPAGAEPGDQGSGGGGEEGVAGIGASPESPARSSTKRR